MRGEESAANSIEPTPAPPPTPVIIINEEDCPSTGSPDPIPISPKLLEQIAALNDSSSSMGASPSLPPPPLRTTNDHPTANATHLPFSPALRQMVSLVKRQLPLPPPPPSTTAPQQQQRQRSSSLKRAHDDDESATNAPKRNLSVGRGPNPKELNDSVIDYWNERNVMLHQQKTRGRSASKGNRRGGK